MGVTDKNFQMSGHPQSKFIEGRCFAIIVWHMSEVAAGIVEFSWLTSSMPVEVSSPITGRALIDVPNSVYPKGALDKFAQPYRQYIMSLICCSQQLADLVESFPALLFALTTDYGTAARRAECVQLINDGASLKSAAQALGLPWWLRKIPAGSLRQPFGELPDGAAFNQRIANLMPRTDTEIRYWLRRVLYAYQACDEDYALWMARHKRFPFRDRSDEPHILLAAWAWFSKQPQTRGHKLLRKQWSANLSMTKAFEEARAWENRLKLAERLGNGLRDTWFKGGTVGAFEFVPLVTVDDFLSEARIMGNCLDQYGDQVTREHARVFSIRKEGTHVANLEIGFHEDDQSMPMIEQLRGPKNRRAGPELWQAAYKWLGGQTYRPMKEGVLGGKEIARKIKVGVWKPYFDFLKPNPHLEYVQQYALGGQERRPRRTLRLAERMLLHGT